MPLTTIKRLTKEHHYDGLEVPKGTTSSLLTEDEKLLLVVRQHPIVLTKTGVMLVLGLAAPFLITKIEFLPELSNNLSLLLIGFWYFFIFSWGVIRYTLWYFNVYLITNRRLIDVNFPSILHSDISIAKLEKIEDTSAKIGGLLGIVFNYGHVLVQTAAATSEFGFYKIAKPELINKILSELMMERKGRAKKATAETE